MSVSALSAEPLEAVAVEHQQLAEVIQLVPLHEHTWALRDTEYEGGFAVRRFECDACTAVRFT